MTDPASSRIYLDTNVFVDAIEGPDAVALPMKGLFAAAANDRHGVLVTSELTLAEVLAPRRGEHLSALLERLYLELIVRRQLIELHPVSREVLLDTASLRQSFGLKLPDAIHLATAIRAGCRFLLTRDEDFKKMPEGMQRIASGPAALASLAGTLK